MEYIKDKLGTRSWWIRCMATTVCVCQLLGLPAIGQDGNGTIKSARKETTRNKIDAKALIDALENHNPMPKIKWKEPGDYDVLFDQKYDWAEYDRVNKAVRLLAEHAEAAWPELLKHLDDKRYCSTYELFDIGRNFSVGDVCRCILRDWITIAYRRYLPDAEKAWRKLNLPDMIIDDKNLEKWCKERSNKKLYELQAEACEWAENKASRLSRDAMSEAQREAFCIVVKGAAYDLRAYKKAVPCVQFNLGCHFNPKSAEKLQKQWKAKYSAADKN